MQPTPKTHNSWRRNVSSTREHMPIHAHDHCIPEGDVYDEDDTVSRATRFETGSIRKLTDFGES